MRRWVACALVLCMVLMLVSCSKPEEQVPAPQESGSEQEQPAKEESAGDEDSGEQSPQPVQLASFYQIEEIEDVFASFTELEYSFTDAENEVVIEYVLLGQETVGNAVADHISITLEESGNVTELEMWVDGEANTLKVLIDGEDAGPMGPAMASLFLMVVVMPFTVYAADWEGAFLQEDGFKQYGWTSASRDQTTRDFGLGGTVVHQYHFKHTAGNQELDYSFEVAEISGMSLFVGWDVELDGANKTGFRITRVIPR